MKNWSFLDYLILIVGILIITYIVSPSARKLACGSWNKLKKAGDKCSNCDTGVSGIITESGQCLPVDQVAYDKCIGNNASMDNGSDCNGCGANPADQSADAYSGKGVIIGGRCVALPDAFAGKICVPSNASVNAKPLSYKRILVGGDSYRYFKNNGSIVSQNEGFLDEEIGKSEYVKAYIQAVGPCPEGQVKA